MSHSISSSPITTNNSLKDIVDWLALGDIVCVHTQYHRQYYVAFDFEKTEFSKKRLIFVDLSNYPSLMADDEWPCYIRGSNNLIYTGDVYPTSPENIFNFKI